MATVLDEAVADAMDDPVNEVAPIADPDGHYEVIDGQLVEIPWMGAQEARIANRLLRNLFRCDPEGRLGEPICETLFVLDPVRNLNRRPDVAFVSRERWPGDRPIPRGKAAWDVVPDLAVEVVSMSNFADEIVDKVAEYFRAGTRLVWVLYPSQDLVYAYDSPESVRILSAGDELGGGAVLPGFRMPVASLFGVDTGGAGQGE